MIETREIVLNGAVYTVTQLPARRALRLQSRLMKALGPAISQMIVAFVNASPSKDENGKELPVDSKKDALLDDAIPKAVTYLVNELDENTLESLVTQLTAGVRKDNIELTPQILDMEFSGDLNTLFLLLKFILEVNYGSFFSEGGILTMFLPHLAKVS